MANDVILYRDPMNASADLDEYDRTLSAVAQSSSLIYPLSSEFIYQSSMSYHIIDNYIKNDK